MRSVTFFSTGLPPLPGFVTVICESYLRFLNIMMFFPGVDVNISAMPPGNMKRCRGFLPALFTHSHMPWSDHENDENDENNENCENDVLKMV